MYGADAPHTVEYQIYRGEATDISMLAHTHSVARWFSPSGSGVLAISCGGPASVPRSRIAAVPIHVLICLPA